MIRPPVPPRQRRWDRGLLRRGFEAAIDPGNLDDAVAVHHEQGTVRKVSADR
jgi:hypothetical protein